MKKAVALAFLLSAAAAATAGYRTSWPVFVSSSSRFAYGNLGYAHNSSDSTQWLGCQVVVTATTKSVGCYATPASGGYASCYSSDPNLIDIAKSLPSDGMLLFYWDANSYCTQITVGTMSYFEPKR